MTERIFQLKTKDIPEHWFNIIADIPFELPLPLDAETGQVYAFDKLSNIYSSECARIELQMGVYKDSKLISIPEEVLLEYMKYRPTPIIRAKGLEKALGYEGRIYFKREDNNPSGSHKPNTAIPQAFYAKKDGKRGLITDTGAGQWGAALAYACNLFNLQSTIFMTRKSYIDKPYRATLMKLVGGKVIPSPSDQTSIGRELLNENPDHSGSLGIGMAEAMEFVNSDKSMRLALGCMSYYAALHQTIIGLEIRKQLELIGKEPDIMIGCVGGGTNFMGTVAPFIAEKIKGRNNIEFIAVESSSIPVLTSGKYDYDFQDYSGLTPRVKMYTLGHDFIPPKIHSGGLRYHGKSPILSLLYYHKILKANAIDQKEAFEVGKIFYNSEGIIPAPETNHAIAQAIREANKAKEEGIKKDILFLFSGTGYLDLKNYQDALNLS